MRPSEPQALQGHRAALAHAGEVAQWGVLLLGWIWLGEQGMRLGWSLASGVLAVALWWAARLSCRGSAWALRATPVVVVGCSVLTACAVFLPTLVAGLDAAASLLALWFVAVVWGLWSGLIETRNPVSTFQLGPWAWHPVLAAGTVALAWRAPSAELAVWGVSLLLAVCALVLFARERALGVRVLMCPVRRTGFHDLLAPSAMGLMMGSLWLGNAWCVGLGWSNAGMVMAHLALMAGSPSLVAAVLRTRGAARLPDEAQACISLGLLALGALMLLGSSPAHRVLAMLLPSLAWAVQCGRLRASAGAVAPASACGSRATALLLGPALLVWVGVSSPLQGPGAVASALALLGVLAAARLAQAAMARRRAQALALPSSAS
ncbi:MAG: hypothetical protein B7X59_02600 [Polaromonas sp. 39-63-203]|jgi:hypothetical protein|uniref:hypothetical protein n=1 Tax=Polaromonas sp. TaxID=1869339 RepID=UPI000BDA5512|nr:hypothetical protein [Polaromonas sp.]OYY53546.1 MAG: hypothetical protein B7Y54_02595 [Polaromonas sp. 35-63-240]OYZ84577.1 MAG: hypothetical protein B7Y03_03095 [Polaromonas sp. 24-62-144]OZB00502.1 MAG: hypothetical protein B7X59_02600 [Polaromonas sp. 39-63-203]HQS31436.1 hypothetical protein [Polaromonas sp.]HQS90770.1 hypothetical protein [Polaromonas sp.]